MIVSYDRVKQELTDLLNLIRVGENTLEDAAGKLREAREKLKEPIDIQREKLKAELEERRNELTNLISNYTGLEDRKAIERLAEEKSQGFPWLSQAYADYFYLQDLKLADYLETKLHPALETANEIRKEIAPRRRIAEQLYRVLKYKLEYYERLFPWLVDFGEEGIDDLIRQTIEKMQKGREEIEEPDDAAKKYLTAAEYGRLPAAEKYQLALDRYWKKKKTKWEIGRDYERYIGYTYESKDWVVHYHGIVEGFADLGRDLICVKKDYAEIVQCKCWAKEYETGKPKEIHEKHVFQLFGTITAFIIDNPDKKVSGKFVTSTFLSDRAWQFAKALGIKVLEDYPLEHYPCIKCNVSRRDGTKIYHLPFDQQYDSTIIEEERNECYVETVKQAEDLGFRRAFRWRGSA
ncbi:MAG: restriction endonuclease [Dehalococcoidia bacterium]